jgi:hypothetical protein
MDFQKGIEAYGKAAGRRAMLLNPGRETENLET